MTYEWPMVPLGKILAKSNEWIDLKPDKTYQEVTVRLWGKGVTLRREVNGTGIAADSRIIVRANQFILSRIDARNGAFGLIPDNLDGAVVSTDFPVFAVNKSLILPDYLNWMSKTASFVDLCKAASEGTTNRVRLKEDRFLATEIPLPPLDQQRRLVARIEALAAKIEEARGLRRLAVEEAEALLASERARVFAQIDLARYGKSISELAVFLDGRRIPLNAKQRADKKPGDIPYYGASGVVDYINEWIFDETLLLVSEDGANIELRSKPIAFIIRGKTWVNNHAHVLRLPTEETAIFLTHYIESLDMRPYWQGATRPKINKSALEAMVIPDLPLEEQRRIVAYLDGLQAKVDALKALQAQTQAELDALLPSVLDKAFKGELL